MLVGRTGLVHGTIGGGALEHEAIAAAQSALSKGSDRIDKRPLGPQLGQCCGGSVTLLTEIWTSDRLSRFGEGIVARPTPGVMAEPTLQVSRALARLRDGRGPRNPAFLNGWMIEPVHHPKRDIWIWGAGHVGRAIVGVLEPLPDLKINWVDSGRERFPDAIPSRVSALFADNPAELASLSSETSEHYVLTYSHALDLEICHRVLNRQFAFLGLIGSATKRARFRARLKSLGHSVAQIDRMVCPIGDPDLGKHPQEIALGVATEILHRRTMEDRLREKRA